MPSPHWKTIGTVPVSNLIDPRLQLHWAAQIVASFGNTVLERRGDDSQSNLGWDEERNALMSHPSPEGFRCALRPADLTLLLLDPKQQIIEHYSLSGKTLDQGFQWLASTLSTRGITQGTQSLGLREYEMPSHSVQQGTPFSKIDPLPFQEYQQWYANANNALHTLVDNWQQASPIRCWPHHFDIGTLIVLDQNQSAEEARSVGCGMSPGDGGYQEPYFYINLWPYPDKSRLGNLSIGNWHTEGWIGAILTATDIMSDSSGDSQGQKVRQFLQEATEKSFSLLGVHPQ